MRIRASHPPRDRSNPFSLRNRVTGSRCYVRRKLVMIVAASSAYGQRERTPQTNTLQKMVVDAVGIDHVGIGTDEDIFSSRTGSGLNRAWQEMTSGFFLTIVAEFLRQGFTTKEITKVSAGNFGRVFGAVTGQA